MQRDQDNPEEKALKTSFYQNAYPVASVNEEVKILSKSLNKMIKKLESNTLSEQEERKLRQRAVRLSQRIDLVLLNAQPALVALSLFNQRMEVLVNALTGMGSDITEEKVRACFESLGMSTSDNEEPLQTPSESTAPLEPQIIDALNTLSLTNTQGSSSSSISTSSNANLEKDENGRNALNKSS